LADGEPSALKMLAMDLFCNRSSFLLPSFLLGVLLYQKRYSIPFPKVVAPGLICAGILVSVFSSTEVVFGQSEQLCDRTAAACLGAPGRNRTSTPCGTRF
jgi:hypothetical protein